MEDLQAIRRLKSGDIGELECLIARYQGKALRTAFLITHDEPMAEDIVYIGQFAWSPGGSMDSPGTASHTKLPRCCLYHT
jgi:hypothetical protein